MQPTPYHIARMILLTNPELHLDIVWGAPPGKIDWLQERSYLPVPVFAESGCGEPW